MPQEALDQADFVNEHLSVLVMRSPELSSH